MFFTTRTGQEIGENFQGIEIKYDGQFRKTGNLFIETEECSYPGQPMHPSGVYKTDNTWLYAIGDEHTLYIFGKKQLVRLHQQTEDYEQVTIHTAKGFKLPLALADQYAEKVLSMSDISKP